MANAFAVLALTILIGSTVGLVALNSIDQVEDEVNEYVSIINRTGDSYQHLLDDLCGMMEIAQRFRDDPDYHYDPADMEYIIMRDGVNGTQELIDLFNELINATMREAEG